MILVNNSGRGSAFENAVWSEESTTFSGDHAIKKHRLLVSSFHRFWYQYILNLRPSFTVCHFFWESSIFWGYAIRSFFFFGRFSNTRLQNLLGVPMDTPIISTGTQLFRTQRRTLLSPGECRCRSPKRSAPPTQRTGQLGPKVAQWPQDRNLALDGWFLEENFQPPDVGSSNIIVQELSIYSAYMVA